MATPSLPPPAPDRPQKGTDTVKQEARLRRLLIIVTILVAIIVPVTGFTAVSVVLQGQTTNSIDRGRQIDQCKSQFAAERNRLEALKDDASDDVLVAITDVVNAAVLDDPQALQEANREVQEFTDVLDGRAQDYRVAALEYQALVSQPENDFLDACKDEFPS